MLCSRYISSWNMFLLLPSALIMLEMRIFVLSCTRASYLQEAGSDLTRWWRDARILTLWMCTVALGLARQAVAKCGAQISWKCSMAGLCRDLLSHPNGLGEKNVLSSIFKVRGALVSGWIENRIDAAEQICARKMSPESRDWLCDCAWL